jgi:peptidase inhibitor family I36
MEGVMRRALRNSPTRVGLLGLLAISLCLVIACQQQKLPTAPSDLTTGIAIYEHANFQGRSSQVVKDISDLKDVSGPCERESSNSSGGTTTYRDWDDCISSIRVAPGWRATVYRDTGFDGQSLEVTEDVSNLQLVPGSCSHDGLNDCVSSIRVRQR